MWKFIAVFVLAIGSFALGFYFGQRPVGTLQDTVLDLRQSIKDMSRSVIDTTMGIEHDLRRRQALLDTKSKIVQSRSEVLDKNFGEAAKQLAESVTVLENAIKGAKADHGTQDVRAVIGTIQEIRLQLSLGKPVQMKKLNDLQQEIDRQLNK